MAENCEKIRGMKGLTKGNNAVMIATVIFVNIFVTNNQLPKQGRVWKGMEEL